ncbi:MAG: hypothetical protein IPM82_06960 [Saprospiraceae bacterium]|nr:hypothetical protein [Saprospiraceae bacterium]
MLIYRFSTIVLLSLLLALASQAQEWKYEGSKSKANSASDSWIDAAGNNYHNISTHKNRGSSGSIEEKSLLILDKHGNFNGRVQVNSCRNRASLYAFRDDMYLTTDYNCIGAGQATQDSRVFDHKGKLTLTGAPFILHRFATVRTNTGYTIFSQSGFSRPTPKLGIRNIDWDFNIEDQEIDLQELEKPKVPLMANISRFPVQTQEGNWVVTFNFGMENESGVALTPVSSLLILTDGKSLLRKFEFERPNEMVQAIQSIGDEIAVLTDIGYRGAKKLYLLDHQLNLKKYWCWKQKAILTLSSSPTTASSS